MPSLLHMIHKHLLPTWLHTPKHTDQAGQFGSKQTWHTARQGGSSLSVGTQQPLTTQKHQNPAFCHPHTAHNNSHLHKPKAPSRRTYLARKPSRVPRLSRGSRSQQEGLPHPGTSRCKQANQKGTCMCLGLWGNPSPQSPPCWGQRKASCPFPLHVWAGAGQRNTPQPHSSLTSQLCAEGQLSSSLAAISRHLTPLNRSPAAEGPLPGRRGTVGSQFLWLVLSAPVSLSSPRLCWSLTRGSTCEQEPDPQPTGVSQGPPPISAGCGSDLPWIGWK